jgi:hypothetical protein
MNDVRSAPELDAVRRLQVRRRATRGLVAGYMHELSERHRQRRTSADEQDGAEQANERSRGG